MDEERECSVCICNDCHHYFKAKLSGRVKCPKCKSKFVSLSAWVEWWRVMVGESDEK